MTPNLVRRQRRKFLTDKMVAALPKKARRYVKPDPEQRGLYVRVPPKGANIFAVITRDPYGKQVWHTIGGADVLTVEEARARARDAIKRINEGKPAVEPPPTPAESFKIVAESWLQRHVAAKKLRTQGELERCLRKYILPHWGDRDFVSIRRSDIAGLLDHVEDHHGSRMADIVLETVRSIGNWYATRHDDYLSPFVRGMRRHKVGARSRTLDDGELRSVWQQAEAGGSFGALVRMLLLTGQRRGAVQGMRWDDIDDNGTWEIATAARAKGNAGALKLPAQALQVIQAQPKLSSNPHVFAAARGAGPMNGLSRTKRTFDERCGVEGWTLHDLRRTARSLLSRAGVRGDISERVLGHTIRGVEGVYDRHQYFDEKADALVRLAALIDEIVQPSPGKKVVRLRPTVRS